MNIVKKTTSTSFNLIATLVALVIGFLIPASVHANPFASAITNDNGTIRFYLNEGGGTVTVVYEDGTTNANFNGVATIAAGQTNFDLNGHTSYQIICHKDGTGIPFQISTDYGATNGAPAYTGWNSPRGLDANRNSKAGYLFGRVYIGNSATNIPGVTTTVTNAVVMTPLATGQDTTYTNTASITNIITVNFTNSTSTNVTIIATQITNKPPTYVFTNVAVTSTSGETLAIFTNTPLIPLANALGKVTAVLVTNNGPGVVFTFTFTPVQTRDWAIYALTPDLANITTIGARSYTNGLTPWNTNNANPQNPGNWAGMWQPDNLAGNASGPYRIRVADDNSLFVTDFGTPGGGLWQFGPNFEYTNLVFNPVGENQGIAAGTHGDPQGVFTKGSIATGDLTIWTFDPGLAAPATNAPPSPFPTLSVGGLTLGYGPTVNGDYNNILRYDIGLGDPTHYIVREVEVAIGGGGSGYLANDVLTIAGGVGTSATVKVTGVNAGAITTVVIVNAGNYTTLPATPNSVTGGTGSGASLDVRLTQVLWSRRPDFAACLGLPGFFDSQNGELTLGHDGKIIGTFRRLNFSDGNLQIFDPSLPNTPRVYTSVRDIGGGTLSDPWESVVHGTAGAYAGVMVSPDGKFLASVDITNGITVASLTNGIPDDASLFRIVNTPAVGNARGMCWDAGGNILVCSSGQGLLRSFSLGNSSTCISSNDATGNNGSFQLLLPPVSTSMSAIANASQNYINSVPAGTPTPGVFRITLNTNNLPTAVSVNFTVAGTAVNPTHYTISTNGGTPGLVLTATNLTFPAGTSPSGNWSADLLITPTATPLFTNTMTVTLNLGLNSKYLRQAPVGGTVFITNTGPQVLLLTAAQNGTTMYRGVTNDYAEFVITRLGDPNGPGNSAASVVPKSYTLTNFDYLGTAQYPQDYTARAQKWNPAVNPDDLVSTIVIDPGDFTFTNIVGNPVYHGDLSIPPTNVSIIISLTNKVAAAPGDYTNLLSAEGFSFAVVSNNVVTLSNLDNRIGPEVVLYANPLTNAADSVNWTLTFAATNMVAGGITNQILVVPNYTNNYNFDGTHDFFASFGFDPSTEAAGAIAPSPVMVASNWNSVLRMTVNKNNTLSPAGVNLYQNQVFNGNYALRFNMYLSMLGDAKGNPRIGSFVREFAAFGVNHTGTNCDWRIASPINNGPNNSGNDRTNQDGLWFAIGAGTGSQTPADFDFFLPPPLPNLGFNQPDKLSNTAQTQNGVFKSLPFDAENTYALTPANVGGQPVDKWVDVSVEITKQTNCNIFMNKTPIFGNQASLGFPITNNPTGVGLAYTNGHIMLGYLDPVKDNGNIDQFVYFSNVRVVELSPYMTVQASVPGTAATNFIVTQGSSLTFTSSASFASAPITNTWYRGSGSFSGPNTGVPTAGLQTNSVNATSMNDKFTNTFNTIVDGTNYMNVFSDAAGSVTSRVVSVEVVFGPTNAIVQAGSTFQFQVRAAGPSAPTNFQWKFFGTNLVNGTNAPGTATFYAGVTTSNLFITNIVSACAGAYSVAVVNPAGTVTPTATLSVFTPSTSFSSIEATNGSVTMTFGSTNAFDKPSSFILQSAGDVTGPYTNNNTGVITGTNPFSVSVPEVGDHMFYRLIHN